MAVVREHVQKAFFSGSYATINWAGPLTPGNLLVCLSHHYNGGSGMTGVDRGQENVVWNDLGYHYYNVTRLTMFYTWNLPSDAGNEIIVYRSGTTGDGGIIIAEYSGILDTSDPLEFFEFHDGLSPVMTGYIEPTNTLTSQSGNLIITGAAVNDNVGVDGDKTWMGAEVVAENKTYRSGFLMDHWENMQQWPFARFRCFKSGPVGVVSFKATEARRNPVKRIYFTGHGVAGTSPFVKAMTIAPLEGQTIVLCSSTYQGVSISSIDQTGVTWEKAAHHERGTGNTGVRAEVWIGAVGSGSSNTLNVNTTAACQMGFSVVTYDNLGGEGLSLIDFIKTNDGPSGTISTGDSPPTVQANELIIACMAKAGGYGDEKDFAIHTPTNGFSLTMHVSGESSGYQHTVALLDYATIQADVYSTSAQNNDNTEWATVMVGLKGIVPIEKAQNPDPADSSIGISRNKKLSWDIDPEAENYDVFFGTDETEVTNGTGATYKGEETEATYDPSPYPTILEPSTTYYWRVDVKASGSTKTGFTWSFTTEAAPEERGTGIKYNVYYSTSKNGPWTKSNLVPTDHLDAGNQHTLTGLKPDTLYYVAVVGGKVVNDVFQPLVPQSIGPLSEQAAGPEGAIVPVVTIKTYEARKIADNNLWHQITVV